MMVKLILLLIFSHSSKVLGQTYTPEQFEDASTIYAHWLTRGLHHESLLSATPLGRFRRVIKKTFPNIPLKYANEFGYTYQQLPITEDMQFAQKVFNSNQTQALGIHRLQFSQALSYNWDFSLSSIINPDIKLYGFGIDLKYNILDLGKTLYTSLRLSHSQNSMSERFRSQSTAIDAIQSLNLAFIDLYAGVRYLSGEVKFTPSPDDFQFKDRQYKSKQLEQFYGIVLTPTKTFTLSLQSNKLDEMRTVFVKLSFGARTFSRSLPDWMQ